MSRDPLTTLRPDARASATVLRAWHQLIAFGLCLPVAVLVIVLVHAWPVRLLVCLAIVGAIYRVPDRVQVLREARDERWRAPRVR